MEHSKKFSKMINFLQNLGPLKIKYRNDWNKRPASFKRPSRIGAQVNLEKFSKCPYPTKRPPWQDVYSNIVLFKKKTDIKMTAKCIDEYQWISLNCIND